MSGLDLDALAEEVAGLFDLEITTQGRYERLLRGDEAGEWVVELDYDLLKRLGREDREGRPLADEIGRSTEEMLAWVAEGIVPVEIVSPPLPLSRLDEVENMISHLREAGAEGTSASAVYAFGMQLNPELPSHKPGVIRDCLAAFMCLYDWLLTRCDVDITRRMTSYANPYPTNYIKRVLAADYQPDLATLIDDYLADNPTRNRALDMLPLFKFLDEERVLARVDDTLIKERPTFHYRLPDCRVDQPGWGLHEAWNDWIEVERLAADEERLHDCCAAYLKFLSSPVERLIGEWASTVDEEWLKG